MEEYGEIFWRKIKMIIAQSYEDLLKKNKKLVFIDVRSPKEYKEAHIPEAINIPVFSDSEREKIGTMYKEQGKKEAIKEALKTVGPKVYDIYMEMDKHVEKNSELVVYCARGGMRSSTVVSLFKEFSLPVVKLLKGYKGYRQYLNEKLPEMIENAEFITLYGKTGSGKTKILKVLEKKGYDVLDLEKCANHRGSLLGSIGLGEKYSQKFFESNVLNSFLSFRTGKIIVEGESKRIGNIIMPEYLYRKIINSRKLLIETELKKRIEIIKEDYLKDGYTKEEIIKALKSLERYIGEKQVNEYVKNIEEEEYEVAIKNLIEKYYDKVYTTKHKDFEKTFQNTDEEKCVNEITEYIFGKK
jgi:tRNA 2-selenouridine synthase